MTETPISTTTLSLFRKATMLTECKRAQEAFDELSSALASNAVDTDDALLWLFASLLAKLIGKSDLTVANLQRRAEGCANFETEEGPFHCFAAALTGELARPDLARQEYDSEVILDFDNDDRMAVMDIVDAHVLVYEGNYWQQFDRIDRAKRAWSELGRDFVPEFKQWLVYHFGWRGARLFDQFIEPVTFAFG